MENDPKRNSGGPVKIFTIRKCRFWINVTMRTIDTPQNPYDTKYLCDTHGCERNLTK